MLGRVVGGAFLPAAPDHVAPGAGQDAYGVRVVFAAVAGSGVDGCGPGAGVPGVGGEVADGVAQLAVDRPPEPDGCVLAGLAGLAGATPASPASDAGSGNRARQSPISASSRAARTVAAPVRDRSGGRACRALRGCRLPRGVNWWPGSSRPSPHRLRSRATAVTAVSRT